MTEGFIGTVQTSQEEILASVMSLYCPDGFDMDPTYSTGNFYKGQIPKPLLRFDIDPQVPGVLQADCRKLPLDGGSVCSVLFDPPFIHAAGKESIMGKRFGSYPSQGALREMYQDSLREFFRVLMPGGILTMKCQDIIESGKQILTHCYTWIMARDIGFEDLDLFVLAGKHKITGHNHKRQVHARHTHCYFFVFRKPYSAATGTDKLARRLERLT